MTEKEGKSEDVSMALPIAFVGFRVNTNGPIFAVFEMEIDKEDQSKIAFGLLNGKIRLKQ